MTLLLVQRHAFVHHGIPLMAKKSVEMGRYGASELMRNKNLQKKAVNYDIYELTPLIQDSVGKQEQPATFKFHRIASCIIIIIVLSCVSIN